MVVIIFSSIIGCTLDYYDDYDHVPPSILASNKYKHTFDNHKAEAGNVSIGTRNQLEYRVTRFYMSSFCI